MKYLIVKGCAGLGNRLVTLSNALEYCKKNDRVLYVDWSDGLYGPKGENVFYKYFKIDELPCLQSLDEIQYHAKSIQPSVWRKIGLDKALYDNYTYGLPKINNNIKERFLPGKGKLRNSRGYFYYQGKPYQEIVNTSNITFILSLFNHSDITLGGFMKDNIKEDVVIFADYLPTYYPENINNYLKLQPAIEDTINLFAIENNLQENAIGIHIRATDRNTDKSVSMLLEKIHKLTNDSNDYSIFLATDNDKIRREIEQSGRNVITYPKFTPDLTGQEGGIHHWSSKNSQSHMAERIFYESIIDMWLLAKCKYLLYMGNSSFSRIAQTLHCSKAIDWLK